MISQISKGVKICVEVFYQSDYSNPINHEFMFAYRITIQNNNNFEIQLLRRHWFILDSSGDQKEVEGEGVVGVQPVIPPGESFQYVSGCNIKSEIGRMFGHYIVQNMNSQVEFKVDIPAFDMTAPSILN